MPNAQSGEANEESRPTTKWYHDLASMLSAEKAFQDKPIGHWPEIPQMDGAKWLYLRCPDPERPL
jgi:hypothetical protein